MTTTIQIRAEIDVAERFKALWERMKKSDADCTQGETLGSALTLLENYLDGKKVDNVISSIRKIHDEHGMPTSRFPYLHEKNVIVADSKENKLEDAR